VAVPPDEVGAYFVAVDETHGFSVGEVIDSA
jgi:hypothetical protein